MFYKENAFWTSRYNEVDEVVKAARPVQKVELHDATLRDGEQTPGVVFTPDDKVRIAEKLIAAGVTRIEAGMPAVSKDDFKAIETISTRFKEAEVFSFARATRGDVDMAAECGVKGVIIEVPIGEPKLKHQFGWTWETVLDKSVDCINYARQKGLKAVFFPYDTTRAVPEDLENLLKGIMKNSPPDAVGLVDTMGCALPQTIAFMVRWMKQLTGGLPIDVHCHNDFGMAVACELAGAAAGAECLHACVNGMGERTGNAALEELVLAMELLLEMQTPYKLEKMMELCQTVGEISGLPIALNKPFAGARNFTRESGIGANLVVENPLAMFSIHPELIGGTPHIALGKKSGKASILFYLNKMGLAASEEQVTELLARVKAMGTEKKRLLSDEEFVEITSAVLK